MICGQKKDKIGEEGRVNHTDQYHPPAVPTPEHLRWRSGGSGCVSGSVYTPQVKDGHGRGNACDIGFSHPLVISFREYEAGFIHNHLTEPELHLQFI